MATTAIAQPYWTYHTAVVHEMGLAVGLPRSNNSDRDSTTFDSPWTNMSDGRGYAVRDLRYEYLAKHLNAFEKQSLGWFDDDEVLVLDVGDLMDTPLNVTLAPISKAGTSHYRSIVLTDQERGPHVFYTLEARDKRTGLYDQALPGTAVVVHEVDLRRKEPAWVLADLSESSIISDYAYTPHDMWVVGEVVNLPRTRIDVRSRHLTDGFKLTVETGLDREPVLTSISLMSDEVESDNNPSVDPQTQPSAGGQNGSDTSGMTGQSGGGLGASGGILLLLMFVTRFARRFYIK